MEIREGLFEEVADYLRREDKLLSVGKAGRKSDEDRSAWCKGPGVGGELSRQGC